MRESVPVQESGISVRAVSGVLAHDEAGELLLVQRSDDGSWGLPGGGVEAGETWAQCAVRECAEETGWAVHLTGLFGIYSDPRSQTYDYPDGRRVQFVGVVFAGRVIRRVREPDGEVLDVRFFPATRLPEPLFGPDRPVLEDFLAERQVRRLG